MAKSPAQHRAQGNKGPVANQAGYKHPNARKPTKPGGLPQVRTGRDNPLQQPTKRFGIGGPKGTPAPLKGASERIRANPPRATPAQRKAALTGGKPTAFGPPPVAPFLTPAQQGALTAWNSKFGGALAALDLGDKNALAKQIADTGTENFKYAQNQDMTNQDMAARGMINSGIRSTALSDLAVTHAAALNVINTNYNTTIQSDQIQRTTLEGENSGEQVMYGGLAVENAQAVPPTVPAPPPPNSAAATSSTLPHAHVAPPAAPPHPTAQHDQPMTTHPGHLHTVAVLAHPAHPSIGISAPGLVGAASHRAANPRPPAPTASGGAGLRVGAPQ